MFFDEVLPGISFGGEIISGTTFHHYVLNLIMHYETGSSVINKSVTSSDGINLSFAICLNIAFRRSNNQ